MLIDQRNAVERRADDSDLKVVTGSGSILDAELDCVGKGFCQERADGVLDHVAMLDVPGTLRACGSYARFCW
jgi:hypothetical protein